MKLDLFQSRSINTRVTLFTLGIFLLSLWLLMFYAGRILRTDMQRLLGYLFSRPLPIEEFEAFASKVSQGLNS